MTHLEERKCLASKGSLSAHVPIDPYKTFMIGSFFSSRPGGELKYKLILSLPEPNLVEKIGNMLLVLFLEDPLAMLPNRHTPLPPAIAET
jgi:hypothetical protein